ncbi:hypothetical protein RchiOBHm_Chr2g0154921 [Rosa chinensis]|uniref:Uncharacterized protein n=1 Tax=Rosa chinensis TaxID=74649 RepID=A0A2P6S142_ROSCH|nr:hypothetical protein RchiOBHm_Chr2g0154921 [Rosa chinensis]
MYPRKKKCFLHVGGKHEYVVLSCFQVSFCPFIPSIISPTRLHYMPSTSSYEIIHHECRLLW